MQILIEGEVLKSLLAIVGSQPMSLETAKTVVAAHEALEKGPVVVKCWECNCDMVHTRALCDRIGRIVNICIHCGEEGNG